MPQSSRISSTSRLDRLLNASLKRLLYCPSCHPRRPPLALPRPNTSRPASTLTSSTAINGTKPTPARYRPLYAALTDVQKKASTQTNLSRLQLALQALESENPPTRVAILGLNVADTARQIARLLLADALEAEGSWEAQLTNDKDDYRNGLLIRYGHPPNSSLPQPRTSVPTLHIPSDVLQKKNVEILISSINTDSPELATNKSTTSDAFLSPIVGTPTSASGRQVLINQPVHRTLVVANGLDELISISEILASTKFSSILDRSMVNVAVELPNTSVPADETNTIILDTTKAKQGLAAIRRSLSEASTYERNWNTSGLPTLTTWLSDATSPSTKQALISSLLQSTSANLRSQALISSSAASSSSISPPSHSSLDEAITSFSRSAHTELQSSLISAWSSRNWRKLSWWKLFWRVDDVGLIISDLVTNAWLPNTEKAVFELSGRLKQVGVEPVDAVEQVVVDVEDSAREEWRPGVTRTIPPEVPYERQTHPHFATASAAPAAHIAPMTSSSPARAFSSEARPVLASDSDNSVSVRMQAPFQPIALTTLISTVRTQTMNEYIADLTVTAQQLVLRTLTITGTSAGLSGLLYFSITAGNMYEAGTVVALGTAYALRIMQTDWRNACRGLEDGLREEGRRVIKRIEGRMRTLVDESARAREDSVEVRTRMEAEDAVSRAQLELKKLMNVAVTVAERVE